MATIAVLAPGVARADWVSPGPLARAHEGMDREDRCESCHEPRAGVSATRCLSCHSAVGGRTWHQKFNVEATGKSCGSCHPEHRGRTFPLIRWTPPVDFDHRQAGFTLEGAHEGARCGACHKTEPRYLGVKRECAGCHADPHASQLKGSCDRCHTQTRFAPPEKFDHRKTKLPLEGKHATVVCGDCHKPRADGKPSYSVKSRRCADCHSDPHEGRTFLSDCADCHTVAGWEKTRGLPPAHGPAGWPLVGKHAPVTCADCHGSDLARAVSKRCVSCHADVHAARFGDDCAKCHDERSWKRKAATGFDHNLTKYPLKGRHVGVACAKCHRPAGTFKATYIGIPFAECADCHKDPHQQAWTSVPPRCASCHDVAGFKPAAYGVEEHQRSRYKLDGSHVAARCEACHTRLPKVRVEDTRCVACHRNVHGDQFQSKMATAGCEGCHRTSGFRLSAFDHRTTRFPLLGVHEKAACASCHKGTPIQYAGVAMTCDGCHKDPHRGQLRPRACTDCHGLDVWKLPAFAHDKLTAYPLAGKHAAVPCAKCHEAVTLGGVAVVRWRLGKLDCAACHTNPHGRSP